MPGSFLAGTRRLPGPVLLHPSSAPNPRRPSCTNSQLTSILAQARRRTTDPSSPSQRAIWAAAGRDRSSGGRTGEFGRDIGGGPTLVNRRMPQSCRRLRLLWRHCLVAMTARLGECPAGQPTNPADQTARRARNANHVAIKSLHAGPWRRALLAARAHRSRRRRRLGPSRRPQRTRRRQGRRRRYPRRATSRSPRRRSVRACRRTPRQTPGATI